MKYWTHGKFLPNLFLMYSSLKIGCFWAQKGVLIIFNLLNMPLSTALFPETDPKYSGLSIFSPNLWFTDINFTITREFYSWDRSYHSWSSDIRSDIANEKGKRRQGAGRNWQEILSWYGEFEFQEHEQTGVQLMFACAFREKSRAERFSQPETDCIRD